LLLIALAASGWLVATDEPPAPAGEISMPTRPTHRTWQAATAVRPDAMDGRAVDGPLQEVDPHLIPRETLYPTRLPGSAPAGRDLFAARSWSRPVATQAIVSPPPAPAPPALPYTVLGKQFDGEQWAVFLSRGDLTLLARPGTILEGTYQVVEIAPPRLVLSYLPLGQPQELAIGDAR